MRLAVERGWLDESVMVEIPRRSMRRLQNSVQAIKAEHPEVRFLGGVHLGLITLASTLAPWLSGALYKSTGGYTATLACCGGAFMAGALMLLPLGRYPRFDLKESP